MNCCALQTLIDLFLGEEEAQVTPIETLTPVEDDPRLMKNSSARMQKMRRQERAIEEARKEAELNARKKRTETEKAIIEEQRAIEEARKEAELNARKKRTETEKAITEETDDPWEMIL